MLKIKSGDTVVVIAGKDKGKSGKVLKIVNKTSDCCGPKIIVEGINVLKKHVRPNPQREQPGGIISREAPLHISNVALLNSQTGKASRVGIKTLKDKQNTKVRYFKSTNEVVDV